MEVHMLRRLRIATAAAFACVLIAALPALASTVRGSSGPLSATMTAGTHTPTCKQKWPVTVTAKLHGKPARAKAIYQFLSGGYLVSTQYPFSKNSHQHTPYHFRGSFYDYTFGPFGALAVGHPLVVRTVVSAGGQTVYLAYDINVRMVSGCKAITTG
jgi:hypothetical protein